MERKADRETLAYHLNLVVTEAVTNAIQYGCANDRKNKIWTSSLH